MTVVAEAGLPDVRIERLSQSRTIAREHALAIIREKAFSTFEHLPPEEYAEGLARAEAGQPEELAFTFDWLIAVAQRAPEPG